MLIDDFKYCGAKTAVIDAIPDAHMKLAIPSVDAGIRAHLRGVLSNTDLLRQTCRRSGLSHTQINRVLYGDKEEDGVTVYNELGFIMLSRIAYGSGISLSELVLASEELHLFTESCGPVLSSTDLGGPGLLARVTSRVGLEVYKLLGKGARIGEQLGLVL